MAHNENHHPYKSLSTPTSPSSPPRHTRSGTYPIHPNPAVQAYHQGLSSHLHDLIRSSSQPSAPIHTHTHAALRPVALIETGRKRSGGSSNSGAGLVGPNGALQGLESLGFRAQEELVNLDEDEEKDGVQDFTARPELIPRRSLLHVPSREPVSGVSSSTSSFSGRDHDRDAAVAASREKDLQRAWQADGKHITRKTPQGFKLKMEGDQGRASVGLGLGSVTDKMEGLSVGRSNSRATTRGNEESTYSQSPNLATDASMFNTSFTGTNFPSRPTSRQDKAEFSGRKYKDEREEYEAKRIARYERRRGDLERRIQRWTEVVHDSSTDEENEEIFKSSIFPTNPSPRLEYTSPDLSLNTPSTVGSTKPVSSYRSNHFSIPLSAGRSATFSTKFKKPMYIIPPTPESETPPTLDRPKTRSMSNTAGTDLQAKLRVLEALTGSTPMPPVRPPHAEAFFLDDPKQLGNPIIQGRRISDDENATILGVADMSMETPKPVQRGTMG